MKKILLSALIALAAIPAAAPAADAGAATRERPNALDLTATAYGGAFDGFGVRRESGGMTVLEVSGKPGVRADQWRLDVPFRVAHRQTFGADLSETSGAIDLEPWYQASKQLRLGLEGGISGAWRPDWQDLYQRDQVTGALAPTDRYSYFAWRAGAQLYARPAAHQHLRARYRYVSYDYETDPNFDPNVLTGGDPMHLTPRDRTEHQVDASWRYVEKEWALGLRADYTFRDYTTLLARNRNSGHVDPLLNPLQQLGILEPSAELELERMEGRLGLSFRYGFQVQDDPYQGFYSSTTHHPRVQVKVAATERLALKAAYEGWYEKYGTDGSTRLEAGTRRTDDRTKFAGEVAYKLAGGLSLRGELGWVKRTTNYRDYLPPPAGTSQFDIRFDYTNVTALAGVEYRL